MSATEHLVEYIPTDPDTPHPLGRNIINHDPANYQWRALVQPPPRTDKPGRAWWRRDVYDQGNQPRCAAEAAVGLCRTSPLRHTFTDWPTLDNPDERQQLYLDAQHVDPWPGSSYDGTSTDAPLRVLRDRGVITSWRWLFGEEELWEWVTNYGPAEVGTMWTHGMFTPDHRGYIWPTGSNAGGHAYNIVQANQQDQSYTKVGSWSRRWGRNGRARIRREVMAQLLADHGEAATIG